MNPGGMRTNIVRRPDAQVQYGDLFSVLPFSNVMTTMTMTGETVARLLEQQFDNPVRGRAKFLQVSDGFTYRYRLNAPPGRHVIRGSLRLRGRAIAATERLRVATNNFLAEGGDGFTVFRRAAGGTVGPLDLDALIAYFAAHSPVAPGPQNRIVRTD